MNIDEDIILKFKKYFNATNEVGGALFGNKHYFGCYIKVEAVSLKYGEKTQISFDSNDTRLFYPPSNMELIGTWHSHPFESNPIPSQLDRAQWSIWPNDLAHVIVGRQEIKIFTCKDKIMRTLKVYEENCR